MFDHFPSAVAHELVATVVTLSALTYTVKLEQSDGRTDAQEVGTTSGYVCIVWKSRTG
jgi:hypothetical protein